MTILHHPSEPLLTASAAGTLDPGQHVAIATHLRACERCRMWTRVVESIGGDVLERLPPAAMSKEAFRDTLARLGNPARAVTNIPSVAGSLAEVPELPAFVRRYSAGPWKWIAPRIHMRPINVPDANETRVFLLKAEPGMKLLPHAHAGLEMTCVLTGSFSHHGGRFEVGDFDLGDADVDHEISIGSEKGCLCLVAMQGRLRLKGPLGRLVQPFIAL